MITGRNKRALEDHFDRNWELEEALQAKGDPQRLGRVQESTELADMHYIRQGDPRGLGHAVLCARAARRRRAVRRAPRRRPDRRRATRCSRRMIEVRERTRRQRRRAHGGAARADPPVRLRRRRAHRRGATSSGSPAWSRSPTRRTRPSNLAVIGRYVLDPAVFDVLREHRARPRRRDPADRRAPALAASTATRRAAACTASSSGAAATTPATGSTTSRPSSARPANGPTSARTSAPGCASSRRPAMRARPRDRARDHRSRAPRPTSSAAVRAAADRRAGPARRPGLRPGRGRRPSAVDLPGFDNSAMDGYAVGPRTSRAPARSPGRAAGRRRRRGRQPAGTGSLAPGPGGPDHDRRPAARRRRGRRAGRVDRRRGRDGDAAAGMAPSGSRATPAQHVRAGRRGRARGEVVLRGRHRARPRPRSACSPRSGATGSACTAPARRRAVHRQRARRARPAAGLGAGQRLQQLRAHRRRPDAGAVAYRVGVVPTTPVPLLERCRATSSIRADLVRHQRRRQRGRVRHRQGGAVTELGTVEFEQGRHAAGQAAGLRHHRAGRTPIFTLPGNPVSSFVSFEVFVRPAIRAHARARARPAGRGPRSCASAGAAGRRRPGSASSCAAGLDAGATAARGRAGRGRRDRTWSADLAAGQLPGRRARGRHPGARPATGCGACRSSGVGERRRGDEPRLTHLDERGAARMVDVSGKDVTVRDGHRGRARARARPRWSSCCAATACPRATRWPSRGSPASGAPSAPRTWSRSCHPVAVHGVTVDLAVADDGGGDHRDRADGGPHRRRDGGADLRRRSPRSPWSTWSRRSTSGAVITDVRVEAKTGGRSGDWTGAVTLSACSAGRALGGHGLRTARPPASTRTAAARCSSRGCARSASTSTARVVVPDGEPGRGRAARRRSPAAYDVVVTTGGTGLSPDRPDAGGDPRGCSTARSPGIAEAIRAVRRAQGCRPRRSPAAWPGSPGAR